MGQRAHAFFGTDMEYLAQRLDFVKPSPTLAIGKLAADLHAAGKNIIGLASGEPDFATPEHIRLAAKQAIDRGETRYTAVDGTPQLKQAIIDKFARDNAITYTDRQITVGTGGKQVLFNALLATLSPGDEVIIPAPYWVSYPDMVLLAEGKPVIVVCAQEQSFKMSAQQLRAAITPRSKWLIINSPSNPTGACYSARELRELADVLLEFPSVMVMTDDIYEHIRYGDAAFSTLAAVEPQLKDRTLTVNGVSKAYAMTGWRIGFAGGPQSLISAMATIQSQSTSNPCSVAQAAAVAALNGTHDFLAGWNTIFRERRDFCMAAFNATEGLSCCAPDGAFYLFPSCGALFGRRTPRGSRIENDGDVARFLLEEAQVAVVPGSAFGLDGFFRISFATSNERLEAACVQIQQACARLR
jgi:aspartate aminotransferase